MVVAADDDSWLTDHTMSETQRANYTPGTIPDFSINLNGIDIADIDSINTIRFAPNHQHWASGHFNKSKIQTLENGVSIRPNKQNALASQYLRIVAVNLNKKLDQ